MTGIKKTEDLLRFSREGIPVIGLAGWSGSGKTCLLEKVIPLLKEAGLTLILVKHDVHGLKFQTGEDGLLSDREGTDSFRFTRAGADHVLLLGPGSRWEDVELPPSAAGAGLILVEGFKRAPLVQIGFCRGETGKGFTGPLSRFEALVTDLSREELEELPGWPVFRERYRPVFHPDNIFAIADFIKKLAMRGEQKEQ